jgi:hypothetical protein
MELDLKRYWYCTRRFEHTKFESATKTSGGSLDQRNSTRHIDLEPEMNVTLCFSHLDRPTNEEGQDVSSCRWHVSEWRQSEGVGRAFVNTRMSARTHTYPRDCYLLYGTYLVPVLGSISPVLLYQVQYAV